MKVFNFKSLFIGSICLLIGLQITGCKPDPKPVTEEEAYALLNEVIIDDTLVMTEVYYRFDDFSHPFSYSGFKSANNGSDCFGRRFEKRLLIYSIYLIHSIQSGRKIFRPDDWIEWIIENFDYSMNTRTYSFSKKKEQPAVANHPSLINYPSVYCLINLIKPLLFPLVYTRKYIPLSK